MLPESPHDAAMAHAESILAAPDTSPRAITPDDVHASHDVRDSGWLTSDPACVFCGIGAMDPSRDALLVPCADAPQAEPDRVVSLPDDAKARLEYPMADGLLDYFPNALAEVSRLSYVATQQHHPEKGMHWDRTKSRDHRNKIMRHLIDTGSLDDKGMRHSAMVAWRALALLQEELEAAQGVPMSRASRAA